MRKLILILFIPALLTGMGYGQLLFPEVYSCFGGDTKNDFFEITWTAGEPLFETVSTEQNILTQGFNQTVRVVEEITAVEEYGPDLAVFPNPASMFLTIRFPVDMQPPFLVRLVSLEGRAWYLAEVHDIKETIDVSGLPDGVYVLKITDGQSRFQKIFKVVIAKSNTL